MSWNDAQAFIQKLNAKTGQRYRLPTEAEWEYAARAGSTTRYPWGDSIGRNNANCDGCGSQWDNKTTAPVASFRANGFGLYDMIGNVWEWVEDCYHDGYSGAPTEGEAWTSGSCDRRVLRGASWSSYLPRDARTANRFRSTPVNRYYIVGFRLARTY